MRDYKALFLEIPSLSDDNRLSSHNWDETESVFSAEYENILTELNNDQQELSYYLSYSAG